MIQSLLKVCFHSRIPEDSAFYVSVLVYFMVFCDGLIFCMFFFFFFLNFFSISFCFVVLDRVVKEVSYGAVTFHQSVKPLNRPTPWYANSLISRDPKVGCHVWLLPSR